MAKICFNEYLSLPHRRKSKDKEEKTDTDREETDNAKETPKPDKGPYINDVG